jgi:hypothetical protein
MCMTNGQCTDKRWCIPCFLLNAYGRVVAEIYNDAVARGDFEASNISTSDGYVVNSSISFAQKGSTVIIEGSKSLNTILYPDFPNTATIKDETIKPGLSWFKQPDSKLVYNDSEGRVYHFSKSDNVPSFVQCGVDTEEGSFIRMNFVDLTGNASDSPNVRSDEDEDVDGSVGSTWSPPLVDNPTLNKTYRQMLKELRSAMVITEEELMSHNRVIYLVSSSVSGQNSFHAVCTFEKEQDADRFVRNNNGKPYATTGVVMDYLWIPIRLHS